MTPVLLCDRPTTLLVPAPIEDATRREFITGVGAAALAAAFLAACGEDDAASEESATPTQGASAYPRTIDTPDGPLTLTERPQRVVAASSNAIMLDHLLQLGVAPAFTTKGSLAPWQLALGADQAQAIENNAEPDIEAFVAAGVDLVVFTDIPVMRERSEAYGNVAPYLFVHNSDVAANLRLLGSVFAKEELAERLIASYEQAFSDWDAPWVPESVSVWYAGSPDQVFVYSPESSFGPLIERLLVPLEDRGLGEPGGYVSYEQLGSVDADLVLVIDPYAGDTRATLDAFIDLPVVSVLPSAQAGRIQRLSPDASYAFLVPSALAIPIALAGLREALEASQS